MGVRSYRNVSLLAASLAAFALPSIAVATQDVRVTTSPGLPATLTPDSSPIQARIKLGQKFASLERLCVTFHFEGDLLDPGDVVSIDLIGGVGVNPGAPSQTIRTLCTIDPPALAVWQDGKERAGVYADVGTSVTISGLEFEAFGVPR